MVKKPEIQYIDKFYIHGSEARVLELKPKRRIIKTVLPLSVPDKTVKIAVDPVALCGIVVAVAMLVLLAVGAVQYANVCSRYQDMMDYVVAVQNRNVELNQEYENGYDLADIEQKALALGMIPASEAKVISVGHVDVPQREPEMTFWEEMRWLMEGLFA